MLRKILCITSLCLSFTIYAQAQIKEGSILVGGAVYYSDTDIKSSTGDIYQKSNSGLIDLSVGKAIKENSVVSIHLEFGPGVSHTINNGNIVYTIRSTGYGGGIFYRKYKALAKDFYIFLEAGANYLYDEQTTKDTAGNKLQRSTYSLAEISLSPGISYKVLKNLHLEVSIPQLLAVQYAIIKTSNISQTSQNQFDFKTNLNSSTLNNLSVGFRLVF